MNYTELLSVLEDLHLDKWITAEEKFEASFFTKKGDYRFSVSSEGELIASYSTSKQFTREINLGVFHDIKILFSKISRYKEEQNILRKEQIKEKFVDTFLENFYDE